MTVNVPDLKVPEFGVYGRPGGRINLNQVQKWSLPGENYRSHAGIG